MGRVVTAILGGGREDIDTDDGYRRWDAAGLLEEERALTPAEVARIEAAQIGVSRETVAGQLRQQARTALVGIAQDIAEDDTIIAAAAPGSAVRALAEHDKARAQQVRALIRLAVAHDLLDPEEP